MTLRGLLQDCVAFTGDVDTVATIALAAATCAPTRIEPDLPDRLYARLEDGPYGRHYLQALDLRLLTWATERTRMSDGC